MDATEIATLSIKELRAFCSSHAIDVTKDRRYRISFINAIEIWNQRSVAAEPTMTIGQSEPDPSLDLPLTEAAAVMTERSTTLLDLHTESDGSSPTSPIVQPTPQPIPQQPAPQQQPKTQYRGGASIVVLVPLILVLVAVILIKVGIRTLIPIIGSLMRFTGSIWQSVSDTDRGIESIDYPLVTAA